MPSDLFGRVQEEGQVPVERLGGLQRAAAFLLALDSDIAANIMRGFNDRELSAVSEEMTRMGGVTPKQMQKVLEEFKEGESGMMQIEPLLEELLERAVGPEKARSLLDRIRRRARDMEPFRALRRLNAHQLESVLKGEHPQVLAIVLNYLDPIISYDLLRTMEEDLRYDVVRRIATTQDMPFEMIRQVDHMLEVRAIDASSQASFADEKNRFQTIAQMLNIAEPGVSKQILEKLGKELPEAAQEIQGLMFVFEDLVHIMDRDMQKLLGELDKDDLILSLKTASPELNEKILGNLSKRARETMQEEIELLGPKPLSEVEEAQKRLVETVRGMEERGEVSINRGSSEELV